MCSLLLLCLAIWSIFKSKLLICLLPFSFLLKVLMSISSLQATDEYFLKKLLNLKGDDGFEMNQVLVSLWYIMGLWPLVYSMLLLPTGRRWIDVSYPYLLCNFMNLWSPASSFPLFCKIKFDLYKDYVAGTFRGQAIYIISVDFFPSESNGFGWWLIIIMCSWWL